MRSLPWIERHHRAEGAIIRPIIHKLGGTNVQHSTLVHVGAFKAFGFTRVWSKPREGGQIWITVEKAQKRLRPRV